MSRVSESPAPITSPKLDAAGFRHAFFTSVGGVSSGPYATLNLSNSVGDSPEDVAENLARVANWLGVAPCDMVWLRQVHGCNVVVLEDAVRSGDVRSTQGDALIASDADLVCCVRTADCVPVLLADRESGRVAAVHAGWRGIVAGVVTCTLVRLSELGTKPNHLVAAIGPHIRVAAFEVSDEVGRLIGAATPRVEVIHREFGARPHVSLVQSVTEQLRGAGLWDHQIDDVGGCTFEESDRFFSYRRSGPASGRHLHAIRPR